jgi:hypothetical protein
MAMLNGRQRMALAMQGRQPDRVPVMCQLSLGHYFLNAPLRPHRIWFTSEGFAQALVTLQRRYRFDGILVNLPGRPPDLLESVAGFQSTADGERLTWRNGDVTLIPWDDNPQHCPADPARQYADPACLDPDRLEQLHDVTGYVWRTYHVPCLTGYAAAGPLGAVPDYFFRTIDLVRAEVGDTISIHGEVFSPFTQYMNLLGYEAALASLVLCPEKASAILERLSQSSVTWAVAQARHGVDAVLISSAFAGGAFISRRMYRQFVLPHERRVAEAVKAVGTLVYTHTCGRIGDRLQLMAETGTQGIDALDPPPLGDVELGVAKRSIGQRLFIKGNMNPVALLAFRSETEVLTEATRCLQAGSPGGGYILSTACSVSPHVEPWKLELLVPWAEEAAAAVPPPAGPA